MKTAGTWRVFFCPLMFFLGSKMKNDALAPRTACNQGGGWLGDSPFGERFLLRVDGQMALKVQK